MADRPLVPADEIGWPRNWQQLLVRGEMGARSLGNIDDGEPLAQGKDFCLHNVCRLCGAPIVNDARYCNEHWHEGARMRELAQRQVQWLIECAERRRHDD